MYFSVPRSIFRNHWIEHRKWVSCMICELYFSKAVIKTAQAKQGILNCRRWGHCPATLNTGSVLQASQSSETKFPSISIEATAPCEGVASVSLSIQMPCPGCCARNCHTEPGQGVHCMIWERAQFSDWRERKRFLSWEGPRPLPGFESTQTSCVPSFCFDLCKMGQTSPALRIGTISW